MTSTEQDNDVNELEFLHRALQILIGSYVIGWFIVIWYTKNIQFLNDVTWFVSSALVLCLTVWLALTLSIRATVWWATISIVIATLRAIVYGLEGPTRAVGAWVLVISGIFITVIAILTVNLITGRLQREAYK